MKLSKLVLIILLLSSVSVLSLSCASESDSAVSDNQIVTVQRGGLTIDITAVGNLALSVKEELAFDMSGTVEEVLVEEGDTVEEGQVLARLDTSEWEEQIKALEEQLTTVERQLETKKRNVSAKEFALRQAQINLQTAEYNVTAIAEVKEAQDAVDDAEYELKFTEMKLKETLSPDAPSAAWEFWANQKRLAEQRLAEAEQELREILAGSSVTVTTDVAIEVATKKLQVEQAQRQIEDALIEIDDAEKDVEDAKQDIKDAQEALDEALNTSPDITAPFAGFITEVNVAGGDEVTKGTVAVQLADPTKFEADILVNEIDIFSIQPGAPASIQVDALAGISLPAKVTHISPTATIQSGVVNYKVTVELESLTPMELLEPSDEPEQAQTMPGDIDELLDRAVKEGRISQEQADIMKERWGQMAGGFSEEQMEQFMERFGQGRGGFSQEQVEQFREGFGQRAGLGQRPAGMMLENLQLREGLTVTVSVIIEERSDVLLVPNQAIIRQGMETYVQVLKDGVIKERSIRTGISNWQYTEVIEGLNEGEKVVLPQGTVTTPTTQQGQRGPGFGMPFFGGGGRGGGEEH